MLRTGVFAILLGLTATQSPPGSTVYVSADDIAATMAAAPEGRVSDQSIRMIDAGGYNVGIGLVRRPSTRPGGAIQHHHQTEVYYVVEGSGTLITGGTLVDGQPLDPDGDTVKNLTGPSSVGPRIQGGESQRIGKDDMLIIPAGTAHGFSNIEEDIAYLVIRVDPDQLVQLK